MEFLASDALQGRGSATQFELIAGRYIASQLRQFGIAPAGDADDAGQKTFLQTIALRKQAFTGGPKMSFDAGGGVREWVHGKEILVRRMAAPQVSGPLQKIGADGKANPDAVVFLGLPENSDPQERGRRVAALLEQGAAAVLMPETPAQRQRWSSMASTLPVLPMTFDIPRSEHPVIGSTLVLSTEAANELIKVADGTRIQITGTLSPPEIKYTWNVVGELRGGSSRSSDEAVILSAHMDHVGTDATRPGDNIYNGADDDASGVVAVLEIARALAAGPKPRRTVYFVLFGSEETGGFGSRHFIARPPMPLSSIVANLQFEMIGRPNPKVGADTLWLTGFERSNLGPELAKHGARLVADPHPEQDFFRRSDNYSLARRGVVAHTISSFGLHKEYHQPSDDLTRIDFAHMTRVINSVVQPIRWLVNSDFMPSWVEGQKP